MPLEGKEMIEINLTTDKQIQNYLLNVRQIVFGE